VGVCGEGAAAAWVLARLTSSSSTASARNVIATLSGGHRVPCGQREDAFYGHINAIFDLLALRSGPNNRFDIQGGSDVHAIVGDPDR